MKVGFIAGLLYRLSFNIIDTVYMLHLNIDIEFMDEQLGVREFVRLVRHEITLKSVQLSATRPQHASGAWSLTIQCFPFSYSIPDV